MLEPASLRTFLEGRMPAALDRLRRMVGINSFTENLDGVARLARLTADDFAPLGFTAECVRSTNPAWGDHLFLTRPGRTPRSLLLISHLDTVFPPDEEARNGFRWQPEGDRVYGPGTIDIKGGTVMIWLVLSALQAQAPGLFADITWRVGLNSSEETFSPDFGEVCRQRCDRHTLAALVFEGEGRDDRGRPLLVVARKGRVAWQVTVAGRGAHAGGKHAHGANAIVQLGAVLPRLAALTDYSRHLTCNVGTVRGGTGLNRVPHEAVAEGELRAFSPEVFAAAKTALQSLAGPGEVRSAADGFPCSVRVDITSETRPWPRNPGSDGLCDLWRRIGEDVGYHLAPEERGGLSDGNPLWDLVPTLDGLGPWGDNDHCSERSADGSKLPEFVAVSSFVPKAVINTLAIARLIETGCPPVGPLGPACVSEQ